MTTVPLVKYHGLGNDFLVALEADGLTGPAGEVPAELVRRLCDRHRGVGADGLIVVRPPSSGGELAMELRNADGSRAETSGNGLRCLALAVVDAGTAAERVVSIETDGGLIEASVGRPSGRCAEVRLTMGEAVVDPSPLAPAREIPEGFSALRVEAANPHLVLLGTSLAGLDPAVAGPPLESARPGGQNVEFVVPDGAGGLRLVVWERGVGLTAACGSGSCAAAAAARMEGLVGDVVTVHNPGGDLVVEMSGPAKRPAVALTGPACRVARLEVELEPESCS